MDIVNESERRDRDWMTSIQEDLKQQACDRKAGPQTRKVMFRVRRQLRELKPEHYAAEEFSFGFFNRSPLDAPKSRGDKCKLAMASVVLEAMDMTEDDWEKICAMVVPDPKEILDLYDELGSDALNSLREVQSVLTLDAIFLAGFLGTIYHEPFRRMFLSFRIAVDAMNGSMILFPLLKDLFKVENQIPLSLIRTVLLILVERVGLDVEDVQRIELVDGIFSAICVGVLVQICWLLPGFGVTLRESPESFKGIALMECDNFLHLLYRMMCQGLREGRVGDWAVPTYCKSLALPSATELQKAGIEFRGRKGRFHEVEFKARLFKGVLYLPTVTIEDDTEEIWRNLVAYEDTRFNYKLEFTHYLELMGKLIESPNDVRSPIHVKKLTVSQCLFTFRCVPQILDEVLHVQIRVMVLRSGRLPVIIGDSRWTNKAMVRIFNNTVLQYCYTGPSPKWDLTHQQIYDFYNKDKRRMYLEFVQIYFGKPWLSVSVVAASALLIMTFLQTFYTAAGYYRCN